jgi:predicted transcriptional regulator
MNSPLDTIEYLARSDHRVEVLEAICTAPRTREDIRDMTNASRVTAGRIIADLEERDWIVRSGKEYEATTSGRFVAREFTRLMGNLEAYATLPPVVEWFPEGQPAFDLCRLDDATVTTADEGDLIAPIRRGLKHIERADHLKIVGNGISHEFAEAIRDAVESGQTNTMVGPPEMVDAVRDDPDLRADVRAILESDRATLFQYEGGDDLPVIQVSGDSVALCSGDHRAMLETDDDAVHDWATSYFESLRSQAIPVSAEAFMGEAAVQDDGALVE